MNYHITKNKELDAWQVKREGSHRVSVYCDTQEQAVKKAKDFSSKNGGGEVRIHSSKGAIRDSDTVAPKKDPFPPRDARH